MFCLQLQQLFRWCICIFHLIVQCSQHAFKQSEKNCSDWNAVKREKLGCIRLDMINQCGYVIGQSQLRILRLANMFESNELDSQVMYVFIYTHYLARHPISYIKYEWY